MLRSTLLLLGLHFLSFSWGLNILLSTKDSWVSKNTRHLYRGLKDEGHNVKLIAPLYNNAEGFESSATEENKNGKREETNEIANGGDFGHLLPVHQTYYKTVKKLNQVPRGAKNVILKKDLETAEEPETSGKHNSKSFGQDPLDSSVWYVNASPLQTLLVAYDVILPQFCPEFKPDLVILGPDEGLSLTASTPKDQLLFQKDQYVETGLESMLLLSMIKKFPVIGFSTGDNHHIYYQDESYFNIQQDVLSKQLLKKNVFTKNIKFINKKVIEMISKLSESTGALLPESMALNVNFPSVNHDVSHCTTSTKNKNNNDPDFKQVVFNSKHTKAKVAQLPKYEVVNGDLEIIGFYDVEITSRDDEREEQTFVDKKSAYYNHIQNNARATEIIKLSSKEMQESEHNLPQDFSDNEDLNELMNNIDELNVLKSCGISVSVNHLTRGNGLSKEAFDIESLLA